MPNPPLNVSFRILHLSDRGASETQAVLKASHNASLPRRTRDVPEEEVTGETVTRPPQNNSSVTDVYLSTTEPVHENHTQPLRTRATGSPAPAEEDDFINALIPEYEDSNEPGSAMSVNLEATVMPTPLSPILLELRWSPPAPPTSYDGFNICIHRDGLSCDLLITPPVCFSSFLFIFSLVL